MNGSAPDLKPVPCPFCGGAAEWEYTPWNEESQTGDDGTGWIKCQGCHVKMSGSDRDDVEARWNGRPSAGPEIPQGDMNPFVCTGDTMLLRHDEIRIHQKDRSNTHVEFYWRGMLTYTMIVECDFSAWQVLTLTGIEGRMAGRLG